MKSLADNRISVLPLISDIYPLERADEAYGNYGSSPKVMGTLLKYGN